MFTQFTITALFLVTLLQYGPTSAAAAAGTEIFKQATRASVVRRAMMQPARREASAIPIPPPVLCGSVPAGVPFTLTTNCDTSVSADYCQKRLLPYNYIYARGNGDSSTTPNFQFTSACGLERAGTDEEALYDIDSASNNFVSFVSHSDPDYKSIREGSTTGTCAVSNTGLLSCTVNTGQADSDTRGLTMFIDGTLFFAVDEYEAVIRTGYLVQS